jgi:hypothetical protein
MLRLKDRTKPIPNGLRFLQPETNWEPIPWSSLTSIAQQLLTHREGNMWLAKKHNWVLSLDAIIDEVDFYNAKICQSQGWYGFIIEDAAPESFPTPSLPLPREDAPLVEAAGGSKISRAVGGINLLTDWLGAGMKPVDASLALKRSKVCLKCPMNQLGDFWQRIEAKIAETIRTVLEIKSDLDLKLPDEDKLHSCTACDCWVPLKSFVPISHIKETTDEETLAKLHPKCWILKESK